MLAMAVISSGAQVPPLSSLVVGRIQFLGVVAVELVVSGFSKVSRKISFSRNVSVPFLKALLTRPHPLKIISL